MPIAQTKIYIGSDHGGFELKEQVKRYFDKTNILYEDIGPHEYVKTDDYPDYVFKLAKKVKRNKSKGILICRNGIGVCIAANKIKGIRAVSTKDSGIAKTSRADDDTNVLCMGQDFTPPDLAKRIIKTWLNTSYSNKPRHKRRLNKVRRIERGLTP